MKTCKSNEFVTTTENCAVIFDLNLVLVIKLV